MPTISANDKALGQVRTIFKAHSNTDAYKRLREEIASGHTEVRALTKPNTSLWKTARAAMVVKETRGHVVVTEVFPEIPAKFLPPVASVANSMATPPRVVTQQPAMTGAAVPMTTPARSYFSAPPSATDIPDFSAGSKTFAKSGVPAIQRTITMDGVQYTFPDMDPYRTPSHLINDEGWRKCTGNQIHVGIHYAPTLFFNKNAASQTGFQAFCKHCAYERQKKSIVYTRPYVIGSAGLRVATHGSIGDTAEDILTQTEAKHTAGTQANKTPAPEAASQAASQASSQASLALPQEPTNREAMADYLRGQTGATEQRPTEQRPRVTFGPSSYTYPGSRYGDQEPDRTPATVSERAADAAEEEAKQDMRDFERIHSDLEELAHIATQQGATRAPDAEAEVVPYSSERAIVSAVSAAETLTIADFMLLTGDYDTAKEQPRACSFVFDQGIVLFMPESTEADDARGYASKYGMQRWQGVYYLQTRTGDGPTMSMSAATISYILKLLTGGKKDTLGVLYH